MQFDINKFFTHIPLGYQNSQFNLIFIDGDELWIANTYTGAIGCFHKDQLMTDLKIFQLAEECGFLVPEGLDEVKLVQDRLEKARWMTSELIVTVAPTLGCNFGCYYCFESKTDAFQQKMGLDNKKSLEVRDFIASNLFGRKSLSVRWFGGEPLLNTSAMLNIAPPLKELCLEADIKFSSTIQTNGYYLTRDTAEILKQCGVSHVQITLDGNQNMHDKVRHMNDEGSYSKILSNISSLIEVFTFAIRINVTKANSKYIFQTLSDLEEIDPNHKLGIYFHAVYSHFNSIDTQKNSSRAIGFSNVKEYASFEIAYLEKLFDLGYQPSLDFISPKALPCSALKADGLMIGPSGEVVKCDHEYGVQSRTVGNVNTGITDLSKVSEWLAVNPKNNPLCPKCPLLPSCLGYCESLRKNAVQPEEACPSKKFNYQKQFELLVAWFKKQDSLTKDETKSFQIRRSPKRKSQSNEAQIVWN